MRVCGAPRDEHGRTGRRARINRASPFPPGEHGLTLSVGDTPCVRTRVWEVEGSGPDALAAAIARRAPGCEVVHCKECHYITEYRPIDSTAGPTPAHEAA